MGELKATGTTYIEAISKALRDEMREDGAVFLMGQDVAAYGGAFKVTRGFLEEFGSARVVNTPIAESGAVGMAVGAALLGRRPVVEMQFADFVACAFNQVANVAAKMYWRTQSAVPLVLRLPTGGGLGAGPFHSQSQEALFAHTPGLKVVVPSTPEDAYDLLRDGVRDPNPVLYFEHKHLYRRIRSDLVMGVARKDRTRDYLPLGRAREVRPGRQITVLTYGSMVHDVLAALVGLDVSVQVIDLRSLVPLDEDLVLTAARSTGKVLIVHEATGTCGFGAELAARVAEKAFEHLDAPVRRLAFPDSPIPYSSLLEQDGLPDAAVVREELLALARW